jgi:beta-glucosidase
MPSTPLFAFGHGLSCTTFEYSPLKLASDSIDVSGDARVTLTITNTGKRRGSEVVQLYAADTATGLTVPRSSSMGSPASTSGRVPRRPSPSWCR